MKKYLYFLLTLLALFISGTIFTYTSGPPAMLTNAPGESDCTSCHGGSSTVTFGTIWNNITLTQNSPYGAGTVASPYTFTLTFSNPLSVKYGFQLCVLPTGANSSSSTVGTLVLNSASLAETQIINAGTRDYLQHTSSGVSAPSNNKSWTFDWIPDTSGFTGNVTFYVSINATNNDNSSGGDTIYTKTFSFNVLPLTWLHYAANYTKNNNFININWATTNEINCNNFEVERTINNTAKWNKIASIKANNNSNITNAYSYKDELTNETIEANIIYYRIKQIDIDGKFNYSKVFSSKSFIEKQIEVFPNPANKELFINFNNELQSVAHIKIFNLNGELVKQNTTNNINNNILVNDLKNGVYFVEINTNELVFNKKILVAN